MSVDPVSLAINAALIAANAAMTASQEFEGPRLDSLDVTTASYGTPMNYVQGVRRFDGVSCIWAEPLREVKRRRKTKGGKYNEYTYYGTWAVAVVDQPVDAVTRIWFDRNLVYDTTGAGPVSPFAALGDITSYMRIYTGTADQAPDPRMAATIDAEFGPDSTPAYRGVTYIVFQDLPLEKLGNRFPQVSAEVVTSGSPAYPWETHAAQESPFRMFGFTYSPDRTRAIWGADDYEIWDVAARTQMIAGALDESLGGVQGDAHTLGVDNAGYIYHVATTGGFLDTSIVRYEPDGVGPQQIMMPLDAKGQACLVLQDGAGVEYVCVTPYSTLERVQIWPIGAVELISFDPNFIVGSYFADSYGDIWCLGAKNGGTSLFIQRIVDTGVRPGSPGYAEITGLSTSGTLPETYGFHSQAHGHFVVSYNSAHLYTIDEDTLTVTGHRALGHSQYTTANQFAAVKPNAASIYIQDSQFVCAEISAADLSTVRSLTLADWNGVGADGYIYDPVNHALISGRQAGASAVTWRFLDRLSSSGVTLRTIVEDVAERCGLSADEFDASALTQPVAGYSWIQGAGKAILAPLLEAFDSEARPHDFLIEFRPRLTASAGTIAVADMGAGSGRAESGARYRVGMVLDTDLPLSASLAFADLAIDQQPNAALDQRGPGTTDSRRQVSLDLATWAAGVDEARAKTAAYLRRQWTEAEEISGTLSRKYTRLEPGDVWTLQLDDVARAAKLKRLEFGADGVLTCEWGRYSAGARTETEAPGAPADGVPGSELIVFGYTKGLVLDIPLARDVDNGLIVYLAATPYSPDTAWPGATFYRGDDGIAFDDEVGEVFSSQASVIGSSVGVLATALPEVWDRKNSVTVKLFDGELESTTEVAVANGANLALLGDELIQFTTATLIAADTYTLSGLLRGRRGTEAKVGTHAAGERFVLMTGVPRATLGASDLGVAAYYKPVTTGGSGGFAQALTFSGASAKPYSPAHLRVTASGGDKVATWVRRTRIGGAWRDFEDASLGEGSEAYVGQVLNGSGAVIRTFAGLTGPTLTYTAAQQATDGGAGVALRVMQVSATVGNGFSADIAL